MIREEFIFFCFFSRNLDQARSNDPALDEGGNRERPLKLIKLTILRIGSSATIIKDARGINDDRPINAFADKPRELFARDY